MAKKNPNDKDLVNLAVNFSKDVKKEISLAGTTNYDNDILGRTEWSKNREDWNKLWSLVSKPKNTPFPNASNVTLPLMAEACNQSSARFYQTIFAAPGMVKTLPVGENDIKRARDIESFMNWQIKSDMPGYEDQTDKMLQALPINGVANKKIFWDFQNDRPVAEYIPALDLVLPYRTKSLETARRIAHVIYLHYDELLDRNERKLYTDFDRIPKHGTRQEMESNRETEDDIAGQHPIMDIEKPLKILEIHMNYAIGGVRKPYIFTIDYESQTLLRAVSREIDGETLNYFQDYHFINNPEGYYSYGFGHFLKPLNDMANTCFNLLFDAGRISNQPFGFFGRRAGFKKGSIKLHPGKMIEVEDAGQVFFPNMQRVDQVLFQVLGLIQGYHERFTSTSDYLSGRESKGTKTPTATGTLAIIEQGLTTFGVLSKRIHRSLNKELRLIASLNQLHMPETKQYRVVGKKKIAFPEIKKSDFKRTHFDVMTQADPSFASKSIRVQEAMQTYQLFMSNPLVVGNPELGIKPHIAGMHKVSGNLLDAMEVKDKSSILPELPPQVMSPVEENSIFMQGDYIAPVPEEDFKAHLDVHRAFIQGDLYGIMVEEYKKLLERHLIETVQMAQEVEFQKRQLGGGAAPQPQPGPGLAGAGGGDFPGTR